MAKASNCLPTNLSSITRKKSHFLCCPVICTMRWELLYCYRYSCEATSVHSYLLRWLKYVSNCLKSSYKCLNYMYTVANQTAVYVKCVAMNNGYLMMEGSFDCTALRINISMGTGREL